jgi:uncharacterized protein YhdP
VVLGLASETGGKVRANLKGRVAAAALTKSLPPELAQRLRGTTDILADLTLRQQEMTLTAKSDLKGLAIDLPAPIGKKAEQTIPTTLTGRDSATQTPTFTFQYGTQVTGAVALPEPNQAARIGLMLGGQAATLPKSAGLTVQGNLHQLDLDAWRKLDINAPSGGPGLPIQAISLSLNELRVFDRKLTEIHIQAKPDKETWLVKLSGQHLQGEIEYGPRANQPGNRFAGHFSKLIIPKEEPGLATTDTTSDLGELPAEVELTAKAFSFRDRALGELALSFRVEKNGLRVDTLRLSNRDGRIDGGGWLSASPLRTTELDLRLASENFGRLLQRLGYAEAIKGGELNVDGKITWLGRPEDFALSHLGGRLNVNLKNGRFTQLDPGAAKLLGILSLQALPRRIALDFRDVFSEGFAFDEIKGPAYLERGVAYLPDLRITGPAAKISMNGKIDLARETQDLRLNIHPRLDEGMAVGAALLGGPVAGVGALVATKLLRDPISKAASFEYLVSGNWDDPKVRKLPRTAQDTPANTP